MGNKNICGKDMWQKISLADISLFIIHVSTHQENSEVAKFNNQADKFIQRTNKAKNPKIYLKTEKQK